MYTHQIYRPVAITFFPSICFTCCINQHLASIRCFLDTKAASVRNSRKNVEFFVPFFPFLWGTQIKTAIITAGIISYVTSNNNANNVQKKQQDFRKLKSSRITQPLRSNLARFVPMLFKSQRLGIRNHISIASINRILKKLKKIVRNKAKITIYCNFVNMQL